jgi:hypothetical protein
LIVKNLVWHRKFLIIEAFNLKSILAAVHFYSHDAARMYCSNNICCNFFIFTFMIFSNAWLMVFLSKISRHDQRWCFIFLESFNSCKNFLSPIFCNSLSFSFFLFFLVEFIFFLFKMVFLILPHPVNLFDSPALLLNPNRSGLLYLLYPYGLSNTILSLMDFRAAKVIVLRTF